MNINIISINWFKAKHVETNSGFNTLSSLLRCGSLLGICNQVGGIYTVIRSKAPCMVENATGPYCMIGPYLSRNIQAELEPLDDSQDIFGKLPPF